MSIELIQTLTAHVLVKYQGTDPAAAVALATSLVTKGHVFRDVTGAITFTDVGAKALPRIAPLPLGNDDRAKCERAMQRERIITGALPDPGAFEAATPSTAPAPFTPSAPNAALSDADKVANAMAREAALKAQFGDIE